MCTAPFSCFRSSLSYGIIATKQKGGEPVGKEAEGEATGRG